MIRLLLVLCAFPTLASAQSPRAPLSCRLPAGLWQQRQMFQREFDKTGGQSTHALASIQSIDSRYRRFVLAVGRAFAENRIEPLNACCDGANGDPEALIFCALARYRLDGRKDPARLLAALPETPKAAAALVDLGKAASDDPSTPSIAASPVFGVTEEIFQLMRAGNPLATATYFYLFRHSGGAYADDVADQLERYLTDYPEALIRNWPVLRRYWNLSEGITWDVDAGWWEEVVQHYRRVCDPADPRCKEILARLGEAARAAGAGFPVSRTHSVAPASRRASIGMLKRNCPVSWHDRQRLP